MTDATTSDQDAAVAAALPFLQAFDLPDKEMAKRLYPAFVKGFRHIYRPPNWKYVRSVRWPDVEKWVCDSIDAALYEMKAITPAMPPLEQATRYGAALGYVLYAVEFIADPKYNYDVSSASEKLYARFQEVADLLHRQGKRIRTDFIMKRINRIGQEKAALLSEETKMLLAKIAALFAQ